MDAPPILAACFRWADRFNGRIDALGRRREHASRVGHASSR
jgi:hypothetical protein